MAPTCLGAATVLLATLCALPAASGSPPPAAFTVVFHVASADGAAATRWIEEQAATANQHFAPAGIAFRVVETRALPVAFQTVDDIPERVRLRRHFVGRAINVFLVDTILDPTPSESTRRAARWQGREPTGLLSGAHIRARGRTPATYILVSRESSPLTLTHELGHFFWAGHRRDEKNIMSYGARRESFDAGQVAAFRSMARLYRQRKAVRLVEPAPGAGRDE